MRNELQRLVDTKTQKRHQLAKVIWDKYFDPQAFVFRLKAPGDKSPDYFPRGDGFDYLNVRLATSDAIIDVCIYKIEISKETGKVSGLHTIEEINGSSFKEKEQ